MELSNKLMLSPNLLALIVHEIKASSIAVAAVRVPLFSWVSVEAHEK
jgi:hypothetical protein